jgi:C1A family cysteine protease
MKHYLFLLCATMALSSMASQASRETENELSDAEHHVTQRIYNHKPSAPESRSYHWAMTKHHEAMQTHHEEQADKFQSAFLCNRAIPQASLPLFADLRPHMPPCYDQGQLGACTGNACAGLIENAQMNAGLPSMTPSRLALYYHARYLEGTVPEDSGATITDIIQAMAFGIPPENEFPYTNYQATFTQQPSPICYKDGVSLFDHEQISYVSVPQNAKSIKQHLAAGRAVIIGIQVYDGDHGLESTSAAQTGMVEMPAPNANALGGHAVLLVGYDDRNTVNDKGGHAVANPLKGRYIVRNSWGPDWGENGHFFLPQDFVHNPNYAYDFWTISKLIKPANASKMQGSLKETIDFFKPKSRCTV